MHLTSFVAQTADGRQGFGLKLLVMALALFALGLLTMIILDIVRSRADVVTERPPVAESAQQAVFIGHGHSPVWLELAQFLTDRLQLRVDEFNRISSGGKTTSERLAEMLAASTFAFLVLTAEDERGDGSVTARPNVIHEAGLFQAKLGFRKAIILLEEGCDEFSNIHGLGQIRFPPGRISACFEEIRLVLEREGLLPQQTAT